jgi:uncharacterized protein YqeY
MAEDAADRFRTALRRALRAAMKERDTVAVSALRSLMSEIDHAEAVDPTFAPPAEAGRIAGGVRGLGAGEVPRRVLDEGDVRRVVDHVIAERQAAATQFEAMGREDDARRLRAEAEVLERLLPTV